MGGSLFFAPFSPLIYPPSSPLIHPPFSPPYLSPILSDYPPMTVCLVALTVAKW